MRAKYEVLTTRQLNRALLARQHLLERRAAPLTQVIDDVGGLQTQYAPSGYISLWSRMRGFQRDDLTQAMEAHQAIHGTLMRVTIHTVSATDYWPMVAAIRRSRQQWLLRVTTSQRASLDLESAAAVLTDIMSDGPRRAREVTSEMTSRGFARQAVGWASLWVDIVRIPPSGTWERRANDLYELAERWLPPDAQAGGMPAEQEGIRFLVGRYLGAFGPARLADFSVWAGIPLPLVREATQGIELRLFQDERGRELVDLPDAPLPDPETPAPVRFLPVWDATLLVHCRRALILPEHLRPRVFNVHTPHSVNTFTVDGQVAGTWRYESGEVRGQPLRTLSVEEQHEVDEEADRLTLFHSGDGRA